MGMGMGSRWDRLRLIGQDREGEIIVLMSGMRNVAVPGLACVCLSVLIVSPVCVSVYRV